MPLHAIRSEPDSAEADSLQPGSIRADSTARRLFEEAMTDAFALVPGIWTARIHRNPASWTVIVERTVDGCRRTLVLAPHQQTPAGVTAELAEALRDLG